MISTLGSILIAVVTAAATIALNELARTLRERAAERKLSADWTVTWTGNDPRLRTRIAIIENIGHTEAFNVNLSISGDAEYEIHPDAPLHKTRPRDAVLVMVNSPGTGVFIINWEDASGQPQGPVYRFPEPT